ncbi:MAG: hypothetical protein FWF72_06820 [Paludibacter sp.]|nr:hypothetical protein [Paludibacter sp.]
MSKQQRNMRVIANRDSGAIEQQTIVDDNLLPSADELQKLKEINPAIIQWIMNRTEKEQDARLEFNANRMKLAHKEITITTTSLWLAFVLSIVLLLISGVFIYFNKELAGTIFGCVGIITIIQAFLKFGRKEKQ